MRNRCRLAWVCQDWLAVDGQPRDSPLVIAFGKGKKRDKARGVHAGPGLSLWNGRAAWRFGNGIWHCRLSLDYGFACWSDTKQ